MLEIIRILFLIAFWAIAIFTFLFGIIFCVVNLVSGVTSRDKWAVFISVVALFLGAIVFFCAYNWLAESIKCCMLATGFVTMMVEGAVSADKEPEGGIEGPGWPPRQDEGAIKKVVEEAIRKTKS